MIPTQIKVDAATSVPVYAYWKASLLARAAWHALPGAAGGSIKRSRVNVPLHVNKQPSSRLRIATYNVWFENMMSQVRYPEILKHLVTLEADVICLQEVTQSFLATLRVDAAIRTSYACLGLEGETIRDGAFHGCIMLVRRATLRVRAGEIMDLPKSSNHRALLSAHITGVAGQSTEGIDDVMVATAHLESPGCGGDNGELARRTQLQFVRDHLQARRAVFCGDTNLCGEYEARLPEALGLRDAWNDAGHPDDTPTSDTLYRSPHSPRRLDRILYTGERARTASAFLFGETPLKIREPTEIDLYLSDHKGVYAELVL